MATADIFDWIDTYARPGHLWCAKRLSANDTGLTGGHQNGPLIIREVLYRMFPRLAAAEPSVREDFFDLYIDSHTDHRRARAVWYDSKTEGRFTNLGKPTRSAFLDPDSTGALVVFAFVLSEDGAATECHAWLCDRGQEEDLFEERLGPVEPKLFVVWEPGSIAPSLLAIPGPTAANCRLAPGDIPAAWLTKFPTGEEIIRKTIEFRPAAGTDVDRRLMRRRQCEYEMFQSVEEATYTPRITAGFTSITGFLGLAQTILQSRKSRSGNSLEIHTREIMKEEGLGQDKDFAYKPVIEEGLRPDFLFPTKALYDDPAFPSERLRMLAAKTTCKDRWRQILNEASRIPRKHLLTLQEGVSVGQWNEMNGAGVTLVVPSELHTKYPEDVRPHLVSLESFLGDVRLLNLPV
ncbi:type II restriction endonuclease [Methylopila sp. M107]|uniref:type II restriction endonuclease n=1 Tax=Methylopila sp. M107 TaxID=1101190 RepID=UPI0003764EA6|nr:type II restriction endonuclease [Methylopila sp. M107]